MKKWNYIFVLLALFGCGEKEQLKPSAYVKWVNDASNGLKVEKTMSDVTYSLQYKPVEYIVANEERTDELPLAKLEERKKALEGMYYFNFRMQSNTEGDVLLTGLAEEQEYYERVNYCSYGMQEDFKLVTATDTLPCKLFNFVRTHGVAPYVDFVLGFERKTQEPEELQIVLEERLFGAGRIKFTIEKESQESIPDLITI